jgi:hypothetical protein
VAVPAYRPAQIPGEPVRSAKRVSYSVTIPRTALVSQLIAQGCERPPDSFDPEKFAVREITDRVAIGRPETVRSRRRCQPVVARVSESSDLTQSSRLPSALSARKVTREPSV